MWGSKNFYLIGNWDRMSDINLLICDILKNYICGLSIWWMYFKFGVIFILNWKKSYVYSLKKENFDLLIRRLI